MPFVLLHVLVFTFFAFLLLAPLPARAESVSVMLFPSGGRMETVADMPVQGDELSFDLPAGVDAGTLDLAVEGATVLHLKRQPLFAVEGRAESSRLLALRGRLHLAREESARLKGRMAALKARVNLWSEPDTSSWTGVADLERLDTLMTDRLEGLHREMAALEPRQETASREVDRLEQEIADMGGDPDGERQGTRVTARLNLGEKAKEAGASVRVRYTCRLKNCGWRPVYRLEARPGAGLVHLVQEAELRQASGEDWENVDILLLSADPGSGREPAPLKPWIVQAYSARKTFAAPRAAVMAAGAMTARAVAEEDLASNDEEEEAGVFPPLEMETSTAWPLGRRSLPAGKAMRFPLMEQDWKAEFFRLARPSQQTTVFLMARVSLPEALELPAGQASYLVDGLPVGSDRFALTGSEQDIFFGIDSRVSAQMKINRQQSGRRGLVDKRQTRSWTWDMEIANEHSDAVRVRVEEPEPQPRDEAIRIAVTSNPRPDSAKAEPSKGDSSKADAAKADSDRTKDRHVLVWTLEVPAHGKSLIRHNVEINAPADMRLDEGR